MSLSCRCRDVGAHAARVGLTAELQPYEVLEAQVLQEDSRRSAGLEEEGDIGGELRLQRGEVEIGGLLVEGGCVPNRLCGQRRGEEGGKKAAEDENKVCRLSTLIQFSSPPALHTFITVTRFSCSLMSRNYSKHDRVRNLMTGHVNSILGLDHYGKSHNKIPIVKRRYPLIYSLI